MTANVKHADVYQTIVSTGAALFLLGYIFVFQKKKNVSDIAFTHFTHNACTRVLA